MNDVIVRFKGMNYLQINYSIRLFFLIGVVEKIWNSGSSLLLFSLFALGLSGPGVWRIADGALARTGSVWTGGAQTGIVTSWTFVVILVLCVGTLLSSPQRTPLTLIVLSLVNKGIIEIFNTHILPAEIKKIFA